MSLSKLQTALRLKNAIECVPRKYLPIGKLVSYVGRKLEKYNDRDTDEDEEEEDDEEEEEEEEEEKVEATSAEKSKAAVGSKRSRSKKDDKVPVAKKRKSNKPLTLTHKSMSAIVDQLATACKTYHFSGWYYRLSVKDYEPKMEIRYQDIDIKIAPSSDYDDEEEKGNQLKKETVAKLWEIAPLSGYGDVRTQTTRVDEKVRYARELTMEHVNVPESINRKLALYWAEHMQPRRVRVEPYKLNVYGPGGHFAPHKDTPEGDLVGSIVLTLYNDSDSKLFLGPQKECDQDEARGSWCCFYPDVVHQVPKITQGYRVTLAFKVFVDPFAPTPNDVADIEKYWEPKREEINNRWVKIVNDLHPSYYATDYEAKKAEEEKARKQWDEEIAAIDKEIDKAVDKLYPALTHTVRAHRDELVTFNEHQKQIQEEVQDQLKRIPKPVGFILSRMYSIERMHLKGQDKLLYDILSQIPEYDLHWMPVLTQVSIVDDDDEGVAQDAKVYPLTSNIIDALTKDDSSSDSDEEMEDEKDAQTTSNKEGFKHPPSLKYEVLTYPKWWSESSKDHVSFATMEEDAGELWKHEEDEGAEYTGNESRAASSDSIYVQMAIVVTEKSKKQAGPTRCACLTCQSKEKRDFLEKVHRAMYEHMSLGEDQTECFSLENVFAALKDEPVEKVTAAYEELDALFTKNAEEEMKDEKKESEQEEEEEEEASEEKEGEEADNEPGASKNSDEVKDDSMKA
jgi:hypothetical protein